MPRAKITRPWTAADDAALKEWADRGTSRLVMAARLSGMPNDGRTRLPESIWWWFKTTLLVVVLVVVANALWRILTSY